MPTITISLTGTASDDRSMSKTISAGDATRWLQAYKDLHGQGLSNAEVFDIWANQLFEVTRYEVRRTEEDVAVKAAAAAQTDIGLT